MSQARAITRKTKATVPQAKPTTYQMPVIVLQQAHGRRPGRPQAWGGARCNQATAGPGSMPAPSRSTGESTRGAEGDTGAPGGQCWWPAPARPGGDSPGGAGL